MAAFGVANGWPPYGSSVTSLNLVGPPIVMIASHVGIVGTAALALLVKRRSPTMPPLRIPFPWENYAQATILLVFFHWGISTVVADHAPPSLDANASATTTWLFTSVVAWMATFLMSLMSTSLLIKCLHRALERDWEFARTSPRRRTYVFLLAAAPIAACSVPSVLHGALLAGVLFKLTTLVARNPPSRAAGGRYILRSPRIAAAGMS